MLAVEGIMIVGGLVQAMLLHRLILNADNFHRVPHFLFFPASRVAVAVISKADRKCENLA